MSISNIETNPLGPDTVTEVDPDDGHASAGDNGGGQETEWLQTARRHMDPLATALSHLGVGRSRDVTQSPGYEGLLTDPEAPFTMRDVSTGTRERPERWIHDQALQVRQVLATNANNDQWTLIAGAAPVRIVAQRPERLGLILQNIGGFPLYIGSTQSKARAGMGGFLMPDASVVNLTASCEWWAAAGPDDDAIIAWLDQFRTDNVGN